MESGLHSRAEAELIEVGSQIGLPRLGGVVRPEPDGDEYVELADGDDADPEAAPPPKKKAKTKAAPAAKKVARPRKRDVKEACPEMIAVEAMLLQPPLGYLSRGFLPSFLTWMGS